MIKSNSIIDEFDAAASGYDQAAALQQQVAEALVAWAADSGIAPQSCLDIGSGTGLVAAQIHTQWPCAAITCLDASPAMLHEAKRKMPFIKVQQGDAANMAIDQSYDAAFSSMLLHWLPDPLAALRHWQKHVRTGGKLFVAVPMEGSFAEWRALCRQHKVDDGLQFFPKKDFASGLAIRCLERIFEIQYNAAATFLHSMKRTGAATPRPGYRPASAPALRTLLNAGAQPFCVTCRVQFLEIPGTSSP